MVYDKYVHNQPYNYRSQKTKFEINKLFDKYINKFQSITILNFCKLKIILLFKIISKN